MRLLLLFPFLVGFEMFFSNGAPRSERVSATALDLVADYHEVAAPPLQVGCNAMCVSPCNGDGGSHLAQAWGALGTVNPHTDCKPFSDCVGHPSCHNSRLDLPGLDRLGSLVALVASGSLTAVGAIRSEFDDIALYNPERAALQIVGCNASVLTAHLPMTKEQLAVWLGSSD